MSAETVRRAEVDRKGWPSGPWDSEPDYAHWVDEATGLDCLAVRAGRHGGWCGYVGVPAEHPAHGKDYPELDDAIRVHGGLSFAGGCRGRICHESTRGEVWWLGFDCNHAWDTVPTDYRPRADDDLWGSVEYRTLDYVRNQVTTLAAQLAAVSQ